MKCKTKFYGWPSKHIGHQPWRIASANRESVRGVIRGAAARERSLHPSAAKAMQRRTRVRLVVAYVRRFGLDEFIQSFMVPKIALKPAANWLSNGYAWWRERGHAYQENPSEYTEVAT